MNTMNLSNESVKFDPIVTKQKKVLKKENLLRVNDGPLPYRLYVPNNYDGDKYHYPLFIFLHGAKERGNNNVSQLNKVVQQLFNDLESPLYQSIAIFPQCPKMVETETNLSRWVNWKWEKGNYVVDEIAESQEINKVLQIVETIKNTYSINDRRIYVMGISMGGFGTWDLLMRHSELFAAGIPICGGGDPNYAANLKNMPIYTFHGVKDPIVPVTGTREMVAALKKAGNKQVIYIELPHHRHNVWDYASKTPGLMSWLFSNVK